MISPHAGKIVVDIPDYPLIAEAFCDELTRAAQGVITSLPFIHNQLPVSSLVRPGEIFEVFVIGGTNGETATVRYEENGDISILKYKAHPELAKFETVEQFLSFIDSYVDPTTKAIGLNFAFTLIPAMGERGQLDGVMVSGDTKGHAFQGLQKERVGSAIERHFKSTHGRNLVASVGNDTVCLIASAAARNIDSANLVAGIVGTGYNMALFLDEHTIVNVQASDFTGFTPTTTGRSVDLTSSNVGEQLYNKEVAAGELFKHYNSLNKESELGGHHLQSTKELAELATSDHEREGDVARALFQRSASLVAAQFAGLYNFKGRPRQMIAIMQGGLFWSGPDYKKMVAKELAQLGIPDDGIVFKKIENSDILGAAKLVTGGL